MSAEAIAAKKHPPTSAQRTALLPAAVLFGITILFNLPLLNSTPLAGTEGHRAITAEQMIRQGNWILPKLFDRYYLAKPPMQYWLIALFHVLAGGASPLVWRMPAIIAAALLNAALCLFSGRWFGRTAAWVAGWAGFGLIALWGQVPSADVDSVDTLFAMVSALVILELLFGNWETAIGWMSLAALSTGAMLLTKGPAGVLPIAGVLLWGALASQRRHAWRNLMPPNRMARRWSAAIAAFAIGLMIFGGYTLLAHWKVQHGTLPPDYEGLQEAANRLHPTWSRFFKSLLVPPELFAFCLPISISLLLLPVVAGGEDVNSAHIASHRMAAALIGSLLLSWLVALVSATENPRWVYTTLPLLCPLAGAVVAGGLALPAGRRGTIGALFSGSILLYAGAAAVFSVMVQHEFPAEHRAILFCWVITAVAAVTAIRACVDLSAHRLARAGGLAAITLVLSTAPFTFRDRLNRTRVSGFQAAAQLEKIIGAGSVVGAGRLVVSEPELLYYAHANVRHFVPTPQPNGRLIYGPATSPGFTYGWIIAFGDELKTWRQQGAISHLRELRIGKTDIVYVGWFDAKTK